MPLGGGAEQHTFRRNPRRKRSPNPPRRRYTPPTPEKFIAPKPKKGVTRGVKRSGTAPAAPGRAPVTRVPKKRRERQVKKAAQFRARTKKANIRIKREAKQEKREKRQEKRREKKWVQRQLRYHLTKGPGPFTDIERSAVETHQARPKYQRQLQKTREERQRREDPDEVLGIKQLGFLEKEAEGRGLLPKAAEEVKKGIRKLQDVGPQAGATKAQGYGNTGRLAEEAVDLAANLPSGVYLAGAAAKEAAQGRPQRAKKLIEDFKKTSAVYAAATGDLTEAQKRALERPLTTALEVSGAKAVVGRGAGATMRSGALGKGAKRAASTKRAAQQLYPDSILDRIERSGGLAPHGPPVKGRGYSRDIINKGVQVLAEKGGARGRRRRGGVPISKPTPGRPSGRLELLRDVETKKFSGQKIAKEESKRVLRETSELVPHGRTSRYPGARTRGAIKAKHAPFIQHVAEGVIRRPDTWRIDLMKRLKMLKTQESLRAKRAQLHKQIPALLKSGDPKKKELGQRLETQRVKDAMAAQKMGKEADQILKLLRDKTLTPDEVNKIFEAKAVLTKQELERQARAQKHGVWTEAQGKQRFAVFARVHMGLKWDDKPKPTAEANKWRARREQTKGLETEVRMAGKAWETAKLKVANYEGALSRTKNVTPRQKRKMERLRAIEGQRHDRYVTASKSHQSARKALAASKPKKMREVGFRDREGRKVPIEKIEAEARRQGVDPILITHRPLPQGKKGAALTEAAMAPSRGVEAARAPQQRRTGEAFESLGREVGAEAIMRQAQMSERYATAAEIRAQDFRYYGVPGHPQRDYADTASDARAYGETLTNDEFGNLKPGHSPLTPVNIDGMLTGGEKLRAKQQVDSPTGLGEWHEASWQVMTDESAKGRWMLLPDDVFQTMRAFDEFSPGIGAELTNLWKDIVLTTSSPSSWLTANMADLTTRGTLAGITPFEVLRGFLIANRLSTKGLEGKRARAELVGGAVYGTADFVQTARLTSMRDKPGAGKPETAARTVGALFPAMFRYYKAPIYAVEHLFEIAPQLGKLGKEAKKERPRTMGPTDKGFVEAGKRLLKLNRQFVDDFADDLIQDPALRTRMQKGVEDVVGRWGKVSPFMRQKLSGFSPFAQWLGAATRYTLMTLPAHHPIKTGIMAGIMEMTEEERQRLGLSFMLHPMDRVLDYQMGTLPMKVKTDKYGVHAVGPRTARMFSVGTASEAITFANIPSFIMPQWGGAIKALMGNSWTGEDLRYPKDYPDKRLRGAKLTAVDQQYIAMGLLLEGGLPFASAARRVIEGGSSDPTSHILAPKARPVWDPKKKKWVAAQGATKVSPAEGFEEWVNPLAFNETITRGQQRQFEISGGFGDWAEAQKKKPKKKSGGGGSYWEGGGGGGTQTKQKKSFWD